MFESFKDKKSIVKIITLMPRALVSKFDKKDFYSPSEVQSVFVDVLSTEKNIEYAYAMFCSQPDFIKLTKIHAFESSYAELRLEVSKKCFDNWPRFNFDSLLKYSKHSTMSDLAGEITDVGLDIVGGF
jgi:hypothetical protein